MLAGLSKQHLGCVLSGGDKRKKGLGDRAWTDFHAKIFWRDNEPF
jgi:hypothetical protein